MPAKAHTFGPGSFKLGKSGSQREIAQQMTKLTLEPKSDFEDDVPVLSGETVPGDASTDWTVKGTANQDFDKASFELFCYVNRLTDMPFLFTPKNTSAVSWSGVCTVVPLTVGGDVKKKNTSDFEFRVIGEPTPVDSTGTPITTAS